jgi:hypothetical protein
MKKEWIGVILSALLLSCSLSVRAGHNNIIKVYAPIAKKAGQGNPQNPQEPIDPGNPTTPEDPSDPDTPTEPEEPSPPQVPSDELLITMGAHPTQGGCGVYLMGYGDSVNCNGQVAAMGAINHTDVQIGGFRSTVGRYLIYGSTCRTYLMVTSDTAYATFPAQITILVNGNIRQLSKSMDYYPYTSYTYANCGDSAAIQYNQIITVRLNPVL